MNGKVSIAKMLNKQSVMINPSIDVINNTTSKNVKNINNIVATGSSISDVLKKYYGKK